MKSENSDRITLTETIAGHPATAKARKQAKSMFTLIELLVVIAIISILMGLLIPVVGQVQNRARKTRARGQMTSLITAIKQYESTYGLLPGPTGETERLTEATYDEMCQILAKVDISGKNQKDNGNMRNIRFLEAPQGFEDNGYIDPWGEKFAVMMDLDYDGEVTGPNGDETLYGNVFVYSFSLNTNDDHGVSDSNNKDDVCSWK